MTELLYRYTILLCEGKGIISGQSREGEMIRFGSACLLGCLVRPIVNYYYGICIDMDMSFKYELLFFGVRSDVCFGPGLH